MDVRLSKSNILKKTAHVGGLSIISKVLGILREILQVHFLGVSFLSDAFSVAFRLPNSLRKIFAEGALSAAVIPTMVGVLKDGSEENASKLMSLLTIVITNLILLVSVLICIFASSVIMWSAPGFVDRPDQLIAAISLLRILIFFLVFISIGSLFSSALQAKKQFLMPAFGPIILNIFYLAGLILGIKYNLSIYTFTLFIISAGFFQLCVYINSYFKSGYRLLVPDLNTLIYFKQIMRKFIPSLITNGILEINLYMDMGFASYLVPGSITLINLSSRFMGIVLTAFAGAFSSVLLSYLSQITNHSPKKLSFYVLEISKFVLWVTLPATLCMSFFSYDIFYTLFYKLSNKFDLIAVQESSYLLTIFCAGLFFFSLNKLLISVYYSMHKTLTPTIIALTGSVFNLIFNWYFIGLWGVKAIAISTCLSAVLQTVLLLFSLYWLYGFSLYINKFCKFLALYSIQVIFVSIIFYGMYNFISKMIGLILVSYKVFLLEHIGFWLWVGPLILLMYGVLYITRKEFRLKLYFLE